MGRKKLRLAFIINQAKRKAAYKKRKKGMLKKLDELIVLCDVQAGAIMYSPFEQEPVIWPSVEMVQQTLARFRRLPYVQQSRRTMSHASFLLEKIEKLSTQLLKLKKENREKEMSALIYKILAGEQRIDSLSFVDLNDLGWVTNMNLDEIDNRVEAIMNDSSASASASTFVVGQSSPQNLTSLNQETSNLVAPTDMFLQQNNEGNMGMLSPPVFPNFDSDMDSDYESWDDFMNILNNIDPSPSSSNNP